MKSVFSQRWAAPQVSPEQAALARTEAFAASWSYRINSFVMVKPDLHDNDGELWWCAKIMEGKFKTPHGWRCWVRWYENKDKDGIYHPIKTAYPQGQQGQNRGKGWDTIWIDAVQDTITMSLVGRSKYEAQQKFKVRDSEGERLKISYWSDLNEKQVVLHLAEAAAAAAELSDSDQ
jgi:hypothetical protein